MDKKDLKALSRKELEKLLSDVKKALQSVKARDQREAKKAAAKKADDADAKPAAKKAPAKKPAAKKAPAKKAAAKKDS